MIFYIVHLVFISAILYVLKVTTGSHELIPASILTVSFLLHWWLGVIVYIKLPKQLNKLFAYTFYGLIILSMALGSFWFNYPTRFFILYGLGFIFVIPLYYQLQIQAKELVDQSIRKYILTKYYLEYLGGFGFLVSAFVVYFNLIPKGFVINLTILGHFVIFLYMLSTNLYGNILKALKS